MKEIELPSGAKLKIGLAPFAASKELYQVILDEAKSLKIEASTEIDVSLFKDAFCAALSSKRIENAVLECAKKCVYNDLKIDGNTFEPVEARQDYIPMLIEVAKENLLPFTKSLSAKYGDILKKITPAQA